MPPGPRPAAAVFVFAAVAPAAAVAALLAYVPAWAGLDRVAAVLASYSILRATLLSVSIASLAALLALAAAVPAGYVISRGLVPLPGAVEALLMIPLGLPPVALGALVLAFLAGPGRSLDHLLGVLFTWRGLLVAQFLVVYPMVVRVVRAAFDSVSPWYEAVARTMGYGWLEAFTRVTLPMAWRGLLAAYLLGFMRSLGEFGASVMLAGVRRETMTLPIAVYYYMNTGRLEEALAAVLASAAAAAAASLLLLRVEERLRG